VHLVDGDEEVRNAQERGDGGMPARLPGDAGGGIDQYHRQVCARGPGDHVARVLLMAWRVGDDERSTGRGEVAVRDVDGDALLALGPQTVGDEREVDLRPAAARPAEGLVLIVGNRSAVDEQPPDQRALAVVDATGGRETQ